MSYIDFLKNKEFIRWQLFPDDTLIEYWNEYIQNHPNEVKEIDRAIAYLKTKAFDRCELKTEERTSLWLKICATVDATVRRRNRYRILRYVSSACAVLLMFAGGLGIYLSQQRSNNNVISGSVLSSEDILLITSNNSMSFNNNINVEVSEKGTATITRHDNCAEPEVEEVVPETINIASKELNKLIVPFGKRTRLTLSDGSQLWINSGSELEFPAQFTGDRREIRLVSGEIYVDVAHDKNRSFHVFADNMEIKVYGTEFNISAHNKSATTITLVEGSIGLKTTNNNDEITLLPHEQAVCETGKTPVVMSYVDVMSVTSWKDGYLLFDNALISNVLEQVARYYNLSFNYDKGGNLNKRRCSGKIYLSSNLDNVMTTISLLSETTYRNDNNQIQIINEPN